MKSIRKITPDEETSMSTKRCTSIIFIIMMSAIISFVIYAIMFPVQALRFLGHGFLVVAWVGALVTGTYTVWLVSEWICINIKKSLDNHKSKD